MFYISFNTFFLKKIHIDISFYNSVIIKPSVIRSSRMVKEIGCAVKNKGSKESCIRRISRCQIRAGKHCG